jgi:NitT/TauT family transport system substrate-binding protein
VRKLFILLIAILSLGLFGCEKTTEKPTVILPGGSPLISVAEILEDTDYQIVAGPDLFPAEFKKQERDIIIAPIIIGTKLYIAGASNYKLHSIIGWGNLYLVSRTKINSLSELEGKSVVAFGENATPGIVLKTALESVNTNLNFLAAVTDVVGPFKTKQYDYALISEPVLERLISSSKDETLHVFDLSKAEGLPKVAQFGVFVNPNPINKAGTKNFLSKIEKNVKKMNNDPQAYASLIVPKFEALQAFTPELLANAIPRMNLLYVSSKDAKDDFLAFINFLNSKNANLIGGKVPNEGFYY